MKSCPECGGEMVIKLGRYGKFYSCKKFPDCKGMLPYEDENSLNPESDEFKEKYRPAPEGEDGTKLELKRGKYGYFWAHPSYPEVKETKPLLLQEMCPKCGSPLVQRQGKVGETVHWL